MLLSVVCVKGAAVGTRISPPRTEVWENAQQSSTTPHPPVALNHTASTVNLTNVCMTKGCVKASAQILDLIDEVVDPCENFYEFAWFVANNDLNNDLIMAFCRLLYLLYLL